MQSLPTNLLITIFSVIKLLHIDLLLIDVHDSCIISFHQTFKLPHISPWTTRNQTGWFNKTEHAIEVFIIALWVVQSQNIFSDILICKIENYLRFLEMVQEKPVILTKHAHPSTSGNKYTASLCHTTSLHATQKQKETHKQQQEKDFTNTSFSEAHKTSITDIKWHKGSELTKNESIACWTSLTALRGWAGGGQGRNSSVSQTFKKRTL